MSEIRYSKFDNQYVIIAPERFHKPLNMNSKPKTNDISSCPFCKGNEEKITREIFSIKEADSWVVRVVPNLYTALNLETEFKPKDRGFFESFEGFGVHEVIIDTPKHISIFEFQSTEYFYLLKSIKTRVDDLKKDIRVKYLSIFKNYGVNAGASQSHPHTQIIGMPIVPISKRELLLREYNYYKKHGSKLLADIVQEEIKEDKRVLFRYGKFVSFMPYASLFPFEVMITTVDDFFSFANLNDTNLDELATILQKSIDILHKEIGEFDFNIEFFEPPINSAFDTEEFFDSIERFHLFYIRIRPRIFNLAGFEVANDMYINPVEPEFIKRVLDEFR
ncbi:MAG: galactose-1-phosphate uridylyltransferase [Epsilonproteobacteria bacterium]|nr:galactose-1-phosphate uridylyltransferase [Campylobacterota bacterium]